MRTVANVVVLLLLALGSAAAWAQIRTVTLSVSGMT